MKVSYVILLAYRKILSADVGKAFGSVLRLKKGAKHDGAGTRRPCLTKAAYRFDFDPEGFRYGDQFCVSGV